GGVDLVVPVPADRHPGVARDRHHCDRLTVATDRGDHDGVGALCPGLPLGRVAGGDPAVRTEDEDVHRVCRLALVVGGPGRCRAVSAQVGERVVETFHRTVEPVLHEEHGTYHAHDQHADQGQGDDQRKLGAGAGCHGPIQVYRRHVTAAGTAPTPPCCGECFSVHHQSRLSCGA